MKIEKENLYKAFMNGAIEVMDNRVLLNKINIFPVPDNDTGSNLYSMMNHIVLNSELKSSVKEMLESIADSAIMGARGNSGLIFAQYFHGISRVTNEYNEITLNDFVLATERGFSHAYKAVEEPVEGTILTTMRVFHESLSLGVDEAASFQELLEVAYKNVEKAVLKTTQQLLSLKKASVVDSGAKGFACFLKGFVSGFKGDLNKTYRLKNKGNDIELGIPEIHNFKNEVIHRYCTEALIEGSQMSTEKIREELSLLGNSLVISGGSEKKRIHIHTNFPEKIFKILSLEQNIISQKVDDMKWQYNVIHEKKYKRCIVTDSIADIPKKILDDEQVTLIHLNTLLAFESYIDKLTITNEDLFRRIENTSIQPTSSQPSIGSVKEIFEFLSNYYEEIIVISVSKELSGTYNLLLKVAKTFDKKIVVINSKQNSVAQGLIVLGALEGIKYGKSSENIIEDIYEEIEKTKILVSIDTLDRMIASGRVKSKIGYLANACRLKPIVTLDKKGASAIEKIAFGRKGANKKILKHLIKVHEESQILKYALSYVDNKALAEELSENIKDVLGFSCTYIVESSSIIAASAGKGAMAVAYTTK